jgi:hypothetical protein
MFKIAELLIIAINLIVLDVIAIQDGVVDDKEKINLKTKYQELIDKINQNYKINQNIINILKSDIVSDMVIDFLSRIARNILKKIQS